MKRRLAREIAVQSLYHMEMNDAGCEAAVRMAAEEATEEEPVGEQTIFFAKELAEGTYRNLAAIDRIISDYLKSWRVERLSKVDRQVLRLGAFELLFRDDVPPKVAINEAIELAKHFGEEDSGKFVNGVLGKMIHDLDQIREKFKEKI